MTARALSKRVAGVTQSEAAVITDDFIDSGHISKEIAAKMATLDHVR